MYMIESEIIKKNPVLLAKLRKKWVTDKNIFWKKKWEMASQTSK